MTLGLFVGSEEPRLYDRVVGTLRARHYARRTEETYVYWIGRFIRFHEGRHPREMREPDVNLFLTDLAVTHDSQRQHRIRRSRRCCSCTRRCSRSRWTGSRGS